MGVFSVRIDDEKQEQLEAIAERMERSKGWLVNKALNEFFAREQHKQQVFDEIQEGLRQVAAGEVVDGQEVLDWLRAWGTEDEYGPLEKWG